MRNKEELLKQYILNNEDEKAVDLLYERVLPQIKRYVKRNSGNNEDALDVFQEAVVIFYKTFIEGKKELKENMFGYAFTIAINCWRKNMKQKLVTTSIDEHELENKITVEERKRTGSGKTAKILLEKLGDKCKDLLSLSIFSDISQEDIMVRLEFNSVGAVKMQFKRCKKKLMEMAKEHPQLINELREIA